MIRQQSAHRLTVAMVAGHHALEALLHPEDHHDPVPYLDDALAELAKVRAEIRDARAVAAGRAAADAVTYADAVKAVQTPAGAR